MFCRHGRRTDRCAICSREAARDAVRRPGRARGAAARPAGPRDRPTPAIRPPASAAVRRSRGREGVRVRKLVRQADDGWRSDLLPGVRGSGAAIDLLTQLVAARLRLERLGEAPPGSYGDALRLAAGGAGEREEATWLLFQTAYYGPLEGTEPFAGLERLRVGVDDPLPTDEALRGAPVGPRGAHAPGRGEATLRAYRDWAVRAGGQVQGLCRGTDPARRFDAAYRSLSLPGLDRGARFEFLLSAAAAGLVDMAPSSLLLDAGRDPVSVAAKRAFRTGDAVLLQRRIGAVARELDLPIAAFDLGLRNWDAAPSARLVAGVPVDVDPDEVALLADGLGLVADQAASGG